MGAKREFYELECRASNQIALKILSKCDRIAVIRFMKGVVISQADKLVAITYGKTLIVVNIIFIIVDEMLQNEKCSSI